MNAIKKILVPTDFSPPSRKALTYACALADATHASLDVIHVAENPYGPGAYMEYYAPPPDVVAQIERETRRAIDGLLTEDEKAKYDAHLVLKSGAPAQEILAYLREQGDIDLVVMATHGRGGVARLMMGSVADRVVRAAPCPVLTLRTDEASKADAPKAA